MTSRRRRSARLTPVLVVVGLVCVGGVAIAVNLHTTGDEGLLPQLPDKPAPREATTDPTHRSHPTQLEEIEPGPDVPAQAAELAGPPASVVRRFAEHWANRNVVLTHAIKEEMVGLSAGAWASDIFRQARLTLPAIEGVRAEGGMVMMKLTSVAPKSKTALVVTEERFQGPDGLQTPPRYELYLARLDQVTPQGYAITAWEPQQ